MGSNRGQQCGEYAVMVGLVALAFIGMQRYITSRVAGALVYMSVDPSQGALGTAVPLDAGSGSSDSLDRISENSNGRSIVTQAVTTYTGDSHAGFILAQPHGFLGIKEIPNVASSQEQILAGLIEGDADFKGYDFLESIESNGQQVTGIFKDKNGNKKSKSYSVLDHPVRDPRTGRWGSVLDLNGNGQFDIGEDAIVEGLPERTYLFITATQRINALQEVLDGWKEILGIEDGVPEDQRALLEDSVAKLASVLGSVDIAHLGEASREDLEAINRTLDRANRVLRDVDDAEDAARRQATVELLESTGWGPSKGEQLFKTHTTAGTPLASDPRVEALMELDNGLRGISTALEIAGEGLPHADQIKAHIKRARDLIRDNAFSNGPDAAQEADAAYALLEGDLNRLVEAAAEPVADNEGPSLGLQILVNAPPWQLQADQFLQDQQLYDIGVNGSYDTFPEVAASKDGEVEGVHYVVIKPGDVWGKEGAAMAAYLSDVPGWSVPGEPHEVHRAQPGRPPLELIYGAQMSPDELQGVVAWVPLSDSGEPIDIDQATGTGSLGIRQSTQPISLPPVEPPKPYEHH